MRITKNEKHTHNSVKFVRKYAWYPVIVQNQWIWCEHYYIGYCWRVSDEQALEDKHGFDSYTEYLKHGRFSCNAVFQLDQTLYDMSTHNWELFRISPCRLPEDPEVAKWLIDNSPLALAMKEEA